MIAVSDDYDTYHHSMKPGEEPVKTYIGTRRVLLHSPCYYITRERSELEHLAIGAAFELDRGMQTKMINW